MTALLDSRQTHVSVRVMGRTPRPATRKLPPASGAYPRLKPFMDFTAAGALLLLSLPVLLLAGLLVKLTSRGPVLYSQIRLGRNGLPFELFKLRTMYDKCESQSGPCWSLPGDKRITPVGRWLRRLHIDELPQLWNILRGEMSLVGPRPERPEIVVSLERALPGYFDRLLVKPGLTGLAQIQLPADTSLESVRDKLALDQVYVNKVGPWLDFRVLMGTALYLTGVSYKNIGRVLMLPTAKTKPAAMPVASA